MLKGAKVRGQSNETKCPLYSNLYSIKEYFASERCCIGNDDSKINPAKANLDIGRYRSSSTYYGVMSP